MKSLLYFDEHRHATWLELFFDLRTNYTLGGICN
ncbi:MAG: low temperature requirement protein LtrA [Clostridium sp.]|jgi:low temperature requirement protein LtrA